MESKEPHAVSLKVLRLSRPSLSQQQPLPDSKIVDPRAAVSPPNATKDGSFILTPMLTLPLAFGSAYVGESFDCTICVNNELPEDANRKVTSVKIVAEMQTPSQTLPLQLHPENEEAARSGIARSESLQTIVHYDLREEGSHTLIVSVSYNESIQSAQESVVSGGRVRSFRKLYQFPVGPCLSVRTKASGLAQAAVNGKKPLDRYALEAQLENLADGVITIEKLAFEPKEPFKSKSINWDLDHLEQPLIAPREVTQVAFLIEEHQLSDAVQVKKEATRDGRTILGILTIHWRSELGQTGVLSTGWLTTRPKR